MYLCNYHVCIIITLILLFYSTGSSKDGKSSVSNNNLLIPLCLLILNLPDTKQYLLVLSAAPISFPILSSPWHSKYFLCRKFHADYKFSRIIVDDLRIHSFSNFICIGLPQRFLREGLGRLHVIEPQLHSIFTLLSRNISIRRQL